MISELSRCKCALLPKRLILSFFLSLGPMLSLSCNQPFQPEIEYTPKLVLYSVLFAGENRVYVRVTSTENSTKADVSAPIHGVDIRIETNGGYSVQLVDSTIVDSSGTMSLYSADFPISSGSQYTITACKQGYDSVSATVTVPPSSTTIPDGQSYAIFRHPDDAPDNPTFGISLSSLTAAYFCQVGLEYRGFDHMGQYRMGYVDVLGGGTQEPFIENTNDYISGQVDLTLYDSLFHYVEGLASNLKESHLYVDIIVTKIDDPLYRFYVTSGRFLSPLAMRTDRIIFSNVANGVGLVGSAAVDTTRIYLF